MKLALYILLACTSMSLAETTHTVQDGVVIDVTIEPTTITVGDTVTLRIDAIAPDQVQLALSNDVAFGSFVITDSTSLLDVPTKKGRMWTWALLLDTFDAASTELTDIEILWSDNNGNSGSISIPSVPMHITSVAGDELESMQLRQIKERVPLLANTGWWTVFASGFVLFVASAIFFFVLRKRSKPTPSPHEQAMLALACLQQENIEVQEFYTRLSAIVRTYIEGQFNISATGQTTREFLIAERENPHLEHQDRKALADFLVAADLVKFARFEPGKQNWNHALQKATEFVSSTVELQSKTEAEVAA